MTSTARSLHVLFMTAGLSTALLAASCSDSTGLVLNPDAVVGCPDYAPMQGLEVAEGPGMLPGAVCGSCHRTGGQAENSPWTLAGTIFATKDAQCGSGGVANIGVDVLFAMDDPNGAFRMNEIQPGGTLRTNSVGNFFTATKFVAPIRIRVYDPTDTTRQILMNTLVGQDPSSGATTRVDCNFCHYPGSPMLTPGNGHIYLP
jgi:hypothetical protein